jgi:hypothetical protein
VTLGKIHSAKESPFVECLPASTRQRNPSAGPHVRFFAECQGHYTRQRTYTARQRSHLLSSVCRPALGKDIRQRVPMSGSLPSALYGTRQIVPLCRVSGPLHSAKNLYLSAFRDRGVPGPTSECRRVPQPNWVEREGEREGGRARRPETGVREVGIPRPSCSSRAQVGCACSRGLQASTRERERAAPSERLSRPRPRAANPL